MTGIFDVQRLATGKESVTGEDANLWAAGVSFDLDLFGKIGKLGKFFKGARAVDKVSDFNRGANTADTLSDMTKAGE